MSAPATPQSPAKATLPEQVAQANELSEQQQADIMAEAKKELLLVVKALKSGNRENVVSQFLAGLHGLRFINLCKKAGKARSFATGELERDLSWWLGKSIDANLVIRTYAAIELLAGDITPPPSTAKAADKNLWTTRVDALPPIGHFHKGYAQFVERIEDGVEERFVLLVGFEERCKALYQECQAKGLKLDDDVADGKVVEKGVMTRSRELMVDHMRFKADKKATEAAAKNGDRAK